MQHLHLGEITGKVLFLGDSITDDGRFVSFLHAFFQLYLPDYDISFHNLGVSSETLSGLTEESHPFPRPCLFGRLDRALETVRPQWVVSLYGINDAIYSPFSEENFARFRAGYLRLAQAVQNAGAQLVACTPVPFDAASYTGTVAGEGQESYGFTNTYSNYNEVMRRYAQWIMQEMPRHARASADLFTAVMRDWDERRANNPKVKTGDGIHPDLHGHLTMAQTLLGELFGIDGRYFADAMRKDRFRFFRLADRRDKLVHSREKETVGHDNIYKDPVLPEGRFEMAVSTCERKIQSYLTRHKSLRGGRGRWRGFRCERFFFEGNPAIAVFPKKQGADGRWVWRTEFFGAFAQADLAMLRKGYTLLHLSIPNQFGAPHAVEQMERFLSFAREAYALRGEGLLFGFSRGALYALHFAEKYPERVGAMYLDAPVVDVRSWPFGLGKGAGSPADASLCLRAFCVETPDAFGEIQSRMLDAVVRARIPLLLVAGDSDTLVPFEENGLLLRERWEAAGIPLLCVLKRGVGHHPHSLKNPAPLVDFLTTAQA